MKSDPVGPFSSDSEDAYRRWRADKLADYPRTAADLMVRVGDAARMTETERAALMARIVKTNMALYDGPPPPADEPEAKAKERVRLVDAQFGLARLDANLGADEDGITSLRVVKEGALRRYIPYTDRPINWHTDGYYNTPDRRIRAMTLHCVRPAAEGGENALFDHEVAYILLRDENPRWIRALSHPQAMTIPANREGKIEIRAAETGPVFDLNADGSLYMRYTVRAVNIEWRDDPATLEAAAFLEELLNGDTPYVFRHRMKPGQGLIANNVLHNRTGFSGHDGAGRLMFRARYLDRIAP